MLTLSVYSADGEFILTCQMEDMASFLHVIHTEFEPRWAADPNKAAISGKMLVIDSVRGPDSMTPVLSQRQREIVELLSRSYSPKQIACALGISESTVRMHINTLKKRFNVTSCYHLMTVVTRSGCATLSLTSRTRSPSPSSTMTTAACANRDAYSLPGSRKTREPRERKGMEPRSRHTGCRLQHVS